ncbi:MAG: hypothetical protein QXY24_03695 [Candidatus Aenigmatarchaeota archaeon]
MSKILGVLVFLISLFQVTEAMNFGSLVKKDFTSIEANDTTKFTILFWNTEETPYQVKLEVVEIPKGWFISLQPKEFMLSSSVGEEYVSLPYTSKPVKAFPVDVFVKPENAKPGSYQIVIKAKAGLPSRGITFFQEREFKLTVNIRGEKIQDNGIEVLEKTTTLPLREENSGQTSSVFTYLFAIFCILVVSLLIYKYA